MMILNALSDAELERFADYSFDPGLSAAARVELDGRKAGATSWPQSSDPTGDLLEAP